MMQTTTKAQVEALIIEQMVAYFHAPGHTKWLHFLYDIGRARPTYRLLTMHGRGEEHTAYFDDLDAAIEAYNRATGA